jgi:RimJ/RimL family protein N-acetyltransferase
MSVIRPIDGKESFTAFFLIATSNKAGLTGTIGQVTVSPLPYPLRLTGTGVILREWRWEDLDDLVALLDEPGIARWTLMPSPFDVEAGLAYLRRAEQGRIGGSRIQLAITTDGGLPLGEVLLYNVHSAAHSEAHEAELGYLVGLPFRRRGLATAALSLLTGYASDTLGFRRLLLRIDRGNTASTSVARRCGYRPAPEQPIQQDGPYGPATLDTWEYLENRPGSQDDRRKNVAYRRYGRR